MRINCYRYHLFFQITVVHYCKFQRPIKSIAACSKMECMDRMMQETLQCQHRLCLIQPGILRRKESFACPLPTRLMGCKSGPYRIESEGIPTGCVLIFCAPMERAVEYSERWILSVDRSNHRSSCCYLVQHVNSMATERRSRWLSTMNDPDRFLPNKDEEEKEIRWLPVMPLLLLLRGLLSSSARSFQMPRIGGLAWWERLPRKHSSMDCSRGPYIVLLSF